MGRASRRKWIRRAVRTRLAKTATASVRLMGLFRGHPRFKWALAQVDKGIRG